MLGMPLATPSPTVMKRPTTTCVATRVARPPRHRCARWRRCRFLGRRDQRGRVIAIDTLVDFHTDRPGRRDRGQDEPERQREHERKLEDPPGEKGDGQRLRHAGQHREPRGHAPRAPDRAHVQLEARPRHDRAEPRRADRRLVRVRQGRAAERARVPRERAAQELARERRQPQPRERAARRRREQPDAEDGPARAARGASRPPCASGVRHAAPYASALSAARPASSHGGASSHGS